MYNLSTSVVIGVNVAAEELTKHFLHCISQQTFKIGLSYPPLAQAGLDSLESWNTHLPSDVLTPYFKNILPCFDGYLKNTTESGKHLDLLRMKLEFKKTP